MDQGLRRFAWRIVLLHMGLLLPLLGIIFLAARETYQSARTQALSQAQKQQSLLVAQTASGLKGYYDSIFGDLELFKPVSPDDEDSDDRIPEDESGQVPGRRVSGFRVPPMVAQQLNGRVAHLFLVERKTYIVHPYGRQSATPTVRQIVARNQDWIDTLDKPTITSLQQFEEPGAETRGFNLIGVPVGPARQFVLVATVPVRATAKRFFDEVNDTSNSGAFLMDDHLTIMAASRPDLIGTTIGASADPQVAAAIRSFGGKGNDGTELLGKPFMLGSETFAPAMVSAQPVKILDRQWYVMIASPLSDVDAVVGRLFKRALIGAIVVAGLITAILLSTATQLIQNRARADRERHAILERELKQAREIQLAWLPQRHQQTGPLDIATINHPASRISGDFYNWFELPDGRTVVAIGDVTGHGMAAAFLMATTQLLVRNTMPLSRDPGTCLSEINRQLCTQVFNGQFVTLLIMTLDPHGSRVQIATAGHPPPLCGDGESYQPLKIEPNIVLGVEADATYSTEVFELNPRSTLLLYTDGVLDALAANGERFGLDRLRRALYGRFANAQSLIDTAVNAINQFRSQHPLCDDLTLVAVQLQPDAVPYTAVSSKMPAVPFTA